ncbi:MULTISPECIES: hypothetical protein [unclassified Amycolatopsis]|uniref:hypothetical protein n=1 Tax=unclassified Amycolatopsis TaxID=2618356 RepID=UPI001C69E02C|nr:hypothetical protein [Amycolatopsis sp. DSM 110486]QYN20261.1 hypothetical protein K1T34_48340 [Amycolatopsis sp. DSM 110486]
MTSPQVCNLRRELVRAGVPPAAVLVEQSDGVDQAVAEGIRMKWQLKVSRA